jgi:hypothetical protein
MALRTTNIINNNKLEFTVFWVVAPCSLVVGNQRFGGRAASIFRVEFHDQGEVPDE